MSNNTSKGLIASLVLLVGGVTGGVMYHQHQEKERRIEKIITTETVKALESAWTNTLEYRNSKISTWNSSLNTALNERYLPWYYSYFTRETMNFRAVGCKLASLVTECDAQKDIESQMASSFKTRILENAGEPSDVVQKIVNNYTDTFVGQINQIPRKYPEINPERLEKFLSNSTVQLKTVEGTSAVSASLASLVSNKFNDNELTKKMVEDMLKDGAEKATKHLTTKIAQKAIGSSAKYLFGPIVKAGFIAFDYYDLKKEEGSEKEMTRVKLSNSFIDMEKSVAEDTEQIMLKIEKSVLQSLPKGHSLSVNHHGLELQLPQYQEYMTEVPVESNIEEPITPVIAASETYKKSASEMPFALQVASRETYEAAKDMANSLPDGDVLAKNVDGKTWYAVLSGGFVTKEEALNHKEYLLSNYSHVGGTDDIPAAFARKNPAYESNQQSNV